MKKILYLLILLIPINVFALDYPTHHYEKAYLYDLTDDKVLYSVKSEEKSDIASLTKIITTITAIENIDDLNQYVTYTSNMASLVRSDLSVAHLKVGDQVTYRDLLYASILPSGADATTAIAISTSGSIKSFVNKMNDTASKIGMTNSHFVNVTGLDEKGHYSTAEDIAKALKYCFQNETFKEIYTTKTHTLSNGLFVKSTIYSYRPDSKYDMNRIIESKTGFTLGAGRCISVYFKSNNHEFILVTLNAPSDSSFHIIDALELINFMDNSYQDETLIEENQLVKTIPVKNSKIDNYEIRTTEKITKYLPSDYNKDNVKIVYEGLKELSYKNKINSKIGTLNYYYEDELIGSEEVTLTEKLELNIFKILKSHKKTLIVIVLVIFILFILFKSSKKKKKNKRKQTKR